MNRVVERLDEDERSLGDDFCDELHIVCPWHGYAYDVRTGGTPATRPHGCAHRGRRAGGEILVRL